VPRTSWPPWTIISLEKGLDHLVEAVRQPDGRDDDEQNLLTRFLVIRTCGYLEQVVQESVRSHLQSMAGGTVKSFALSWMGKSRNPSPENLLDIVGRFDESWRAELQDMLDADDKSLNRELSMLVHRRHQIAHGLNEGLNPRKALDLVTVAKTLADWFIRRFNPDAQARRRANA
jgi:hypothetical protein